MKTARITTLKEMEQEESKESLRPGVSQKSQKWLQICKPTRHVLPAVVQKVNSKALKRPQKVVWNWQQQPDETPKLPKMWAHCRKKTCPAEWLLLQVLKTILAKERRYLSSRVSPRKEEEGHTHKRKSLWILYTGCIKRTKVIKKHPLDLSTVFSIFAQKYTV